MEVRLLVSHSNPQPRGQGYSFLSGSSSLTSQAWETLPVATTPLPAQLSGSFDCASPHIYNKVEIPGKQIVNTFRRTQK